MYPEPLGKKKKPLFFFFLKFIMSLFKPRWRHMLENKISNALKLSFCITDIKVCWRWFGKQPHIAVIVTWAHSRNWIPALHICSLCLECSPSITYIAPSLPPSFTFYSSHLLCGAFHRHQIYLQPTIVLTPFSLVCYFPTTYHCPVHFIVFINFVYCPSCPTRRECHEGRNFTLFSSSLYSPSAWSWEVGRKSR